MHPLVLTHGEATLFGELYASDDERPLPGVLVFHTGLGLGPHVRSVSEKLRDLGYAALLADMFGGDFNSDPAKTGPLFAMLEADRNLLRERVVAWFEHFKALPGVDPGRIAAIGYCFGGLCVLELARSGADVKAVSSFHGLLTTHAPASAGVIKGTVAAWCGGRDPYAPQSDVEAFRTEMAAANVSLHLTVFEQVQHGFTDPVSDAMGREGIGYNALAADVAWAGTLAMLVQVLKTWA